MTRDLLFDICDELRGWGPGEPEPSVEFNGEALKLRDALGRLWHNTDLLPAQLRSAVADFVDRRADEILTYAAAAQALMPIVKSDVPA